MINSVDLFKKEMIFDTDSIFKPKLNDQEWEEQEKYFICNALQRSDKWHLERKVRVTASNFGTAAGFNKYKTVEELVQEFTTGYRKPVSDFCQMAMEHGTKYEEEARIKYEKYEKVKVIEYGLVIPKWDMSIGASVDGVVIGTDGIIEIKCPQRMYKNLLNYIEDVNNGIEFPPFYKGHIEPTHYCQMQGCMEILDKNWCDYVVYYKKGDESKMKIVRIERDRTFWNEILYPKIKLVTKKILDDLISKQICVSD